MRQLINITLLIFIVSNLSSQEIVDFTINFDKLSSNSGFVMTLVQDEKEQDVAKLVIPIKDNKASVTVQIPSGMYGISAFHDENSNQELDVNFFGAPTEAYGFSNNARGTFSKPDFKETLVKINGNQTITFKLE